MSETKKEQLLSELRRLDEEIARLNARIPPHSVKPVFIQQLDELEEKRDAVLQALEKLEP